ncbi:MAG TPA: hypothetical protein VGC30_03135 [Dokdonella sp.]
MRVVDGLRRVRREGRTDGAVAVDDIAVRRAGSSAARAPDACAARLAPARNRCRACEVRHAFDVARRLRRCALLRRDGRDAGERAAERRGEAGACGRVHECSIGGPTPEG